MTFTWYTNEGQGYQCVCSPLEMFEFYLYSYQKRERLKMAGRDGYKKLMFKGLVCQAEFNL